jgi:hypothetical protein
VAAGGAGEHSPGRAWRFGPLLLVAALAVAGCNGSSGAPSGADSGPRPADGGADLAVADAAATDLAPPPDLAPLPDEGPVDLAPVAHGGIVLLVDSTNGVAGKTTPRPSTTVLFYDYSVLPSGCQQQLVGPCQFSVFCQQPGAFTFVSAGDITIRGGMPDPVSLVPARDAIYAGFNGNLPLFTAGKVLRVSAAGADVPGFATTVVAPATPVVTAPVLQVMNDKYALTIDRTRDLPVTWRNVTDEVVAVGLTAGDVAKPRFLSCRASGRAGGLVVPAAALQLLDAGNGYLAVEAGNLTTVTAGRYLVNVGAVVVGLTGDGGGYSATVTLR